MLDLSVQIVLVLGDNTYGCVLASNVLLCCLVLSRNHYLGNTHQETGTSICLMQGSVLNHPIWTCSKKWGIGPNK